MRWLHLPLFAVLVAAVASLPAPASAQDRTRTKDLVVGLGAEPRTMLAVTIVDWTTNNMLEHIYDRLLDRDAKTLKPKPMLATGWKVVNGPPGSSPSARASGSTTASRSTRSA